jgi:hypothetical protein
MKFVRIGFAILLAAFGASGAMAQTMSYSDAGALIASSCGKDIEKYCPKVNLGGGGIKDCMLAQQTKINPQCLADFQKVVASIDVRVAAQAAVPTVCKNDAARYCEGTAPGNAHFLSCLNTATKVVSKKCKQALADAGWN